MYVLLRANWCIVHGMKYQKGVAVHTGGDGLLPQFSCIEKIVTVPGKDNAQVFFVLKEIVTLNYESHLHAYRARVLNEGADNFQATTNLYDCWRQ